MLVAILVVFDVVALLMIVEGSKEILKVNPCLLAVLFSFKDHIRLTGILLVFTLFFRHLYFFSLLFFYSRELLLV